MERLKEIEMRASEIAAEAEKANSAEALSALEEEVNSLKAERDGLKSEAEKRSAFLKSIAAGAGKAVRKFDECITSEDATETMEYRRAFMGYVLNNKAIPGELRANAVTKTPDLGEALPKTVLDRILENFESIGMILPLVTHTAYKGGVAIPTSSAKPVATWVNEGAGSDKQKKAVDGSITFAYHKLRCAVAVTLEVDTMAIAAFETMLVNNITEAMIKALEQSIITGTGTGQPKGILTETPATGQTVTSAAPSYNDLVKAEAALPLAYENGAVWCMSKKTFMEYAGLVDSNGQPIGRVNYGITGKPERVLLGRPVVLCDYVASYASNVAANTVFAFLFNFKDYVLNTNYAMTVKKYEDNDTDDMVTKAIMLADGKVIDKGSLVTIKKGSASA